MLLPLGYLPGEDRASLNAIKAMEELGIDLSQHRARQLTKDMIDRADLILTMTEGHRDFIRVMDPEPGKDLYPKGIYR